MEMVVWRRLDHRLDSDESFVSERHLRATAEAAQDLHLVTRTRSDCEVELYMLFASFVIILLGIIATR